jgi:hypothetical protein
MTGTDHLPKTKEDAMRGNFDRGPARISKEFELRIPVSKNQAFCYLSVFLEAFGFERTDSGDV